MFQQLLNEEKKQNCGLTSCENELQCGICQKIFATRASLKRHAIVHMREKSFMCKICNRSFLRRESLSRHKMVMHAARCFECEICQKTFFYKYDRARHFKTHTGQKPFQCDICHCMFSEASNLKKHMMIHTGEKPFECDLCLKKFTCNSNLKKHRVVHAGKKYGSKNDGDHVSKNPFQCDNQEILHNRNILIEHENSCCSEKLFKCEICLKMFSQKRTLQRHYMIHTGEKPFECDVCPKKFIDRRRLNNHMLEHTAPLSDIHRETFFQWKSNKSAKICADNSLFECGICHINFSKISELKLHQKTHGVKFLVVFKHK